MKRDVILSVIRAHRYSVTQYIYDAYAYANKKLSIRIIKRIRHNMHYDHECKDEAVIDYTLDLITNRTKPLRGKNNDKR